MAKLNANYGYGQLELNQVAFRRDGRIEAQCRLVLPEGNSYVENGMILAINPVARTAGFPDENSNLFALNFSRTHVR
jgi:hypothetical protein